MESRASFGPRSTYNLNSYDVHADLFLFSMYACLSKMCSVPGIVPVMSSGSAKPVPALSRPMVETERNTGFRDSFLGWRNAAFGRDQGPAP